MADNENLKKALPPRRNPQNSRPPPGVQKAMQTFGVRDLREILDKKRQEQGEPPGDKRPDPKTVKLPPPDPSYNYLKDPTRDKPRSPHKKANNERPIPRDRETSFQRQHKDQKAASQDARQQENKENYSNLQEKGVLKKNQHSPQSDGAPRKELRFSDTPAFEGQPQRGGRHSFRGRNSRRGGGTFREVKEEKIENPVNIKIELSMETGRRSCTLDENTKIPDIKHVPDQISTQRPPRGGFRGGRDGFRGKGRGRGSFRGRGAASSKRKGAELEVDAASNNNSFNMEKLKKTLPDSIKKENNVPPLDNGNVPSKDSTPEKNHEDNSRPSHENLEESYDDYDQDNDEYNDANENYDDEYSGEYYSEYHDNSSEQPQEVDSSGRNYEMSPELEQYECGASDIIDPSLKATITITSSKFQEGGVKRSIEVAPKSDVEEKEGSQGSSVEKNEEK